MNHYKTDLKDTKMKAWRKFAAETMERFPPSFLIILFMGSLYLALENNAQIPAVDWITERFGISADFWKAIFLLNAAIICYFRPAPKYTLLLSLPAALLGGFVLWFGVETRRDMIAIVFIFFAWLAIGIAVVVMVLYQEQLEANELLAEKVSAMQKEQAHAPTDTPPAQS